MCKTLIAQRTYSIQVSYKLVPKYAREFYENLKLNYETPFIAAKVFNQKIAKLKA